jgi:hypothetical protein
LRRSVKIKNKKIKNLYELHRGINKNRIEWEKEHQLVTEIKCCEKIKIKMLKFEFELVLYLYRWEVFSSKDD